MPTFWEIINEEAKQKLEKLMPKKRKPRKTKDKKVEVVEDA